MAVTVYCHDGIHHY